MAIATELWLLVIVCQVVAYVGQYPSASDSVRDAARSSSSGLNSDEIDLMTSTGLVVGVFTAVGVILAGVSLLVTWMARTGRNWARLALTFFSAFLVVQAILALFGDTGPRWTVVPTVIGGVAALGAAYLLVQKETEKYCKDMITYRKSGGAAQGAQNHLPYPPQQYPQPGQAYYQPNQYPSGQHQGPYPQNPYQPNPYQPNPYQPGQYPTPDPHGQFPQGRYPQQGGYPPPGSGRSPDDRADNDAERGE